MRRPLVSARACGYLLACLIEAACHQQHSRKQAALDAAVDAASGGARVHANGGSADAGAIDAGSDAAQRATVSADSPIAIENRLPGSDAYGLTNADASKLSGYTASASIAPGETLHVSVNVDHDQDVHYELYRMGYYQGHGARLVSSGASVPVSAQPDCPLAADTGLIECHWASALSIPIDADWLSGYYLIRLINADGIDAHVPFIVREGAQRAAIVVQASVTTWQAYNLWGGTSLYKNTARDPRYTANRARRVSFDRPYTSAGPFLKESDFVRWLEQRGYDASYVTNLDVEADRLLLRDRKVFVTVLHDEYWPLGERDALDEARDAGVSLFFLSANTGYWRVRLDPSASGVPRRIITCYKSATLDPNADAADTTVQFRQTPYSRPENELLGIMYGDWSDAAGYPFVVADPAHWIYAGTGVRAHETLSPIIGLEWDGVVDNGLTPAGLEVVADSPAISEVGVPFPHVQASVYYPTPHSFVFAAGSINFITRLVDDPDARVQRMLENVFARAGFVLETPTVPQPSAADGGEHPRTAKVLTGSSAGYRDGPAASALFNSPAGVAAGPNGELYIADTGNQLIRELDAAGNVSTLAGCAPDSSDANATCFDHPTGIAVDAQGVVYVSDTGHQRIWTIAKDGTLSLFAGSGQQGSADAIDAKAATFANPRGLALGPQGELYVADFDNGAIRRIDASGVTTVGKGIPTITGVAVDAQGKLYFASNDRVVMGTYEAGQVHELNAPDMHPLEGLMVDAHGLIFADSSGYRIRRMDPANPSQIETLLGNGQFGDGDTQVVLPRGITAFANGYAIADSGNHRIVWIASAP